MPEDVKLYRVFIATPSGLESERAAFRETINEYNESEAVHRKALFLPVGWEDTLSGIGRPQALINADLLRCDYFVLVLWDRWGSPPGGGSHYTSGTEEEYRLAMKCVADKHCSMREVIVFFKPVDEQRLKDPGEQLKLVIKFKKELVDSRSLLFSPANNPVEFGQKVRRHLANWLRTHESESLHKARALYEKTFVAPKSTLSSVKWTLEYTPSFTSAVSSYLDSLERSVEEVSTDANVEKTFEDLKTFRELIEKFNTFDEGIDSININLLPSAENGKYRVLSVGRWSAYSIVDEKLRRAVFVLLTLDNGSKNVP